MLKILLFLLSANFVQTKKVPRDTDKISATSKGSPLVRKKPKEDKDFKRHVVSFQGKKLNEHFSKKKENPEIKSTFAKLKQEQTDTANKMGLKNSKFSQRLKKAPRNVLNIAKNAYDNTVGYGIAKVQNYQTTRSLKKNPNQDVAYVVHGVKQNIGSGWRRKKALEKKGFKVYHVGVNHKKDLDTQYKSTSKKIDKLHKKAKIENAKDRQDGMLGHSSGGNQALYAARQKDIKKTGIKYVLGVASTPRAMDTNTNPETKGLAKIINIGDDNANTEQGRKYAIKLNKNKPYISTETVSGQYDEFVPVKESLDPHANKHHVINHPDSTHFGTSGSNSTMNKILANILSDQKKSYLASKKEYKVKNAA